MGAYGSGIIQVLIKLNVSVYYMEIELEIIEYAIKWSIMNENFDIVIIRSENTFLNIQMSKCIGSELMSSMCS